MTDKRWERVDKAFAFFSRQAINGEPFTLHEIADFTGWVFSTTKTYSNKRWSSFLTRNGDQYHCTKAFAAFDQRTFRQHHSQNDSVEKYFYMPTEVQLLIGRVGQLASRIYVHQR